jgi:predicted MFS family arabinose efflux permease
MPLWLHLLIVPAIGIFALIAMGRNLLRSEEDGHGAGQAKAKKASFFKMPNQVWLLSAGLFTGIFGELALMDWSAVYSKTVLSLDAGRGAIPYAAFSLAMIIGRLSINKLGNKWHISLWDVSMGGLCVVVDTPVTEPLGSLFSISVYESFGLGSAFFNAHLRWRTTEADNTYLGMQFEDPNLLKNGCFLIDYVTTDLATS